MDKIGRISTLVASLVLFAPFTLASTAQVFTTSWGHPDLQGVWDYRTVTPLERPLELGDAAAIPVGEEDGFIRGVAEHQAELFAPLTVVGGEPWADVGTELSEGSRASLIYDPSNGRLPPRTEKGEQLVAETLERFLGVPDDPEDRPEQERCIIYPRIPLTSGNYNNNLQIIQTPDYVVLLMEMFHDARIVPLDGRSRLPVSRWLGQSQGHFEGDTLVVETTGFKHAATFEGYSDQRTVIERFTRLDENRLSYDYTVDDPVAFASPWSARQTLVDNNERIYEYACHEGNYSMMNMLRGARAQDAIAVIKPSE